MEIKKRPKPLYRRELKKLNLILVSELVVTIGTETVQILLTSFKP